MTPDPEQEYDPDPALQENDDESLRAQEADYDAEHEQ